MGSLTIDFPKALLPFRGKPLVEYSLDCLTDARVDSMHVVIGHERDKISAYLRARSVEPIEGCADEHVFYAIWRGCKGASQAANTLVFLDGDTIVERNLFDGISDVRKFNCDAIVVVSHNSNSFSQWTLLARADGFVTDIQRGRADQARAGILFGRKIAEAVFARADSIRPLDLWRRENEFLQGYEAYQLGWGLFLRLALELKARVRLVMSPLSVRNVNRPSDLV
jgi:CTP:phosphocholine cytidylyltransferase-like protein